jgi:hypothetical protein
MNVQLAAWAWAAAAASAAALSVATPVMTEPRVNHTGGWAEKKSSAVAAIDEPELLGTLVDVHGGECVPLDRESPTDDGFSGLLADRATGRAKALDPRLLGLLRDLAAPYAPARIELVSGYRSPKLNEMLRKKGHHVASHSQHSLGHAVDFRLIPAGATDPLDPREVEAQIRARKWDGGVGVYEGKDDRFVHADVGPTRRWDGL